MKNNSPDLGPFAATIGIDWADQKHDLWIQPSDGSKPEHRRLEQTPEAVHNWVAKIRDRFEGRKVAIGIETSRGALISALQNYDFLVIFPINPLTLANYRTAFKVSGAKDDPNDSRLAEEIIRLHPENLRPLKLDTELTRTIGTLSEDRRQFVDQRTGVVNQLHSHLKTYYPLVEDLFEDMTLPICPAFLLRWPSLASLQKATLADLREFFFGHNSRRTELMDKRLKAIKSAKALTTDVSILKPAVVKTSGLAGMLQILHSTIKELDQMLKESMDLHPDAFIFRSFPGAGPVMAPRILFAFGTDRDRFESAQAVQELYGIAPVKKQSGQMKVVHMRQRCPKFGRQSFHENAGQAAKSEPWAKAFYDQQRGRKKGHHTSVRSLSFKLIRIYYRCWKDKTTYSSEHYLAGLKKQGSPLSKILTPE